MNEFLSKHPSAFILGALLIINLMFAVGNVVLLYQTNQKNNTADAALETAELRLAEAQEFNEQAAFTATSGELSQYQEQYQPHLVRWTSSDNTAILFYSTNIAVTGPYDDSEEVYWWIVNSSKNSSGTESFEMPSYAETGDTTYYHFSYRKDYYSNVSPFLESYRHIKVGTQIYEIECDYQAIPSGISLDDTTEINEYIKQKNDSSLLISYKACKPPMFSVNPLVEVTYDDETVYSTAEEKPSPCGCLNCCCDVCTCAKK